MDYDLVAVCKGVDLDVPQDQMDGRRDEFTKERMDGTTESVGGFNHYFRNNNFGPAFRGYEQEGMR